MSAVRSSRLDLASSETELAAEIVALVDSAIEARVGRAISRATGGVRAESVEGVIPPRSGGTGSNTELRPHDIDTHTNVEIVDPQPGQVLVYYPDGVWRNTDFDAASIAEALTIGGESLTIDGEVLTIG